jgi:hypothetical protein
MSGPRMWCRRSANLGHAPHSVWSGQGECKQRMFCAPSFRDAAGDAGLWFQNLARCDARHPGKVVSETNNAMI